MGLTLVIAIAVAVWLVVGWQTLAAFSSLESGRDALHRLSNALDELTSPIDR